MRQFRRGDIADSRFVFIDVNTEEPINVINTSCSISHFVNNVKIIDATGLSLVNTSIGEYIFSWQIPNNAVENETYYVVATGEHPVDGTIAEIEDSYFIVPSSMFSDMIVKFTKD